jgi:lipoprotein-anchoring transpeptidase ErfK/SrfK
MNRTSEELEMAALQPTRNHTFHIGHAVAIFGIALALAVGAFGAGAAASLGAINVFSRSSTPQPEPTVESVGSPVAPSPSAITPTPAATPVPTPTPNPRQTGKVIVVSIAEQRLTAYQDGAVVLTSVVATGQPALPTPTGTFHLMTKSSPYKFVSPWPKGDQYWYPTEWVSYAMLFADDGYFLHDAPWRTVWGPGANLTRGSHGCINVPKAAMATLYSWATVGTTVIVE